MASTQQLEQMVGMVLHDTYRLERLVGAGGMGAVFEASHNRVRRRFAVKLLFPAIAADPEALQRFRREAEVTSELGHPNIVEVVDFNRTADGMPYLVMELLDGRDLGAWMRGAALPVGQVCTILRQTASALAAAHARGIVHRDLKPQNIFVAERGGGLHIKIVDFGISKILGAQTALTGTQAIMGTPYYMAPEQAEGRNAEIDQRTDIFALGTILYEMLTGRPPFMADSIPSVLYRIVHVAHDPVATQNPSLPVGIDAVLQRALAKQPADRYTSVEVLAHEAEAALQQRPDAPLAQAQTLIDTGARAEKAGHASAPGPEVARQSTLSASVGELKRPVGSRKALLGIVVTVALIAAAALTYMLVQRHADKRPLHAAGALADARVTPRPSDSSAPSVPDAALPTRASLPDAALAADAARRRVRSRKLVATRPKLAELRVNAAPWATVYVDGKRAGDTPVTWRGTSGVHIVRVERAGYVAQSRRLTLRAGQNIAAFKLHKKP